MTRRASALTGSRASSQRVVAVRASLAKALRVASAVLRAAAMRSFVVKRAYVYLPIVSPAKLGVYALKTRRVPRLRSVFRSTAAKHVCRARVNEAAPALMVAAVTRG